MQRISSLRIMISLCGLAFLAGTSVRAQDHPHHHQNQKPLKPSVPRTACDAGNPFEVKDHALRSDARHHFSYYVGGGAAIGGRGNCPSEGTWGWDYAGLSKVRLNWTRGRYQGGGGTYKVETSHPVDTITESLLHRD